MAAPPDAPRPVRAGEELPLAALRAFLDAHLPDLGELSVEQFPGGYSNLTYLLRAGDGREFVLRRPPHGARHGSAHDMLRERRILAALHPCWPKVPRPLVACDDEGVIGAPFYVMERVRGLIPRAGSAPLPPERARARAEALIDTLAELHAVDVSIPGLADLGRPDGYAARQVRGWGERWARARSDDVPEVERLLAWLAAHVPPDGRAALLHNDFKFDNVVFDPDRPERVVAVLDWEMATLGDPLLDLGTTLAYWAERDDPAQWRGTSVVPATLDEGCLSRLEVVERYARACGHAVPADALLFAFALGLFKLAVIAQQIYARFLAGHARDARFAGLGQVVRACGRTGLRALDLGRIDRLG